MNPIEIEPQIRKLESMGLKFHGDSVKTSPESQSKPMTPTDTERKLFLAKCLPERIFVDGETSPMPYGFYWKAGVEEHGILKNLNCVKHIRETEWLHVCWLVEQTLDYEQRGEYATLLAQTGPVNFHWNFDTIHKDWQERTTALLSIKSNTPTPNPNLK